MSYQTILYDHEAGVATITFNRPDKLNALNHEMLAEFKDALDRVRRDPEIRVLLLTGTGRSFIAGADIQVFLEFDPLAAQAFAASAHETGFALEALPIPVIAAVNGPAIAGGMILATIPDFTLATPESKFGFNEVRVGFVPAIAASFLLRQVGEKRSRELLLTGRLLKAQEAFCMGLVTQVVAAEELMQTAHALAQTLLQNSPQAMQAVKRLLAKHARRWLDEEIEDAIEVNALQRSTEDFKEGVQAFLQHRKPEWPSSKGRG